MVVKKQSKNRVKRHSKRRSRKSSLKGGRRSLKLKTTTRRVRKGSKKISKNKRLKKIKGGNPYTSLGQVQTALDTAANIDAVLTILNDRDSRRLATEDKTKNMNDLHFTDAIREINRIKSNPALPVDPIPNILNLRTIVTKLKAPALPPQQIVKVNQDDVVNLSSARGSRPPPLPAKKT